MVPIKNIKLGADPEMFIKLLKNNKIVPCVGVLGGTKEKPIELVKGLEGFLVQEDNVMAEFCIPPASTAAEFSGNIAYAIELITNQLKHSNHGIDIKASHEFDLKDLNSEQAQRFGCDPDYNAYTLGMNNVDSDRTSGLRTCGGHIHIGYDNPDFDTSIEIIKRMDLFLGVPSIVIDQDKRRRMMYGKAGCFRMKKYGVEYRTLSNFWIADPVLSTWAFNNTMAAIQSLDSLKLNKADERDIINCIDTQDIDIANILCKTFDIDVLEQNILL